MKAKSLIGILAGGVTAIVGLATTLKGVKSNKDDEYDATLSPIGEDETEETETEETPEVEVVEETAEETEE